MSVFAQTEMLFVPIWALIVLGERPRPSSLIGGTIIFAAVIGKAVLDARPVHSERPVTIRA
jgi:drug/metabolite transporter (DMT)-like permease